MKFRLFIINFTVFVMNLIYTKLKEILLFLLLENWFDAFLIFFKIRVVFLMHFSIKKYQNCVKKCVKILG